MIRRLLAQPRWPLRLSVSATTRQPRPSESNGTEYHFWDRPRFESAIARQEFLEYAEVHGQYYGTLTREVEPFRANGIGVILDIDVKGAAQVRRKVASHMSIFVYTSSFSDYEDRLRRRGTEDEAAIRSRLDNAKLELSHASEYQYQILNDDLETATARLSEIVASAFLQGD